MKTRLVVACIVAVAFGVSGFSQTDVNTDVDRTLVYEQVVKEGYGTPAIYKALGNGHYFKGNYEKAKKWYEKLFETEALTDPTLTFRYKQSLKALDIDYTTNRHLNPTVADSN
jgi:hypothetical protein